MLFFECRYLLVWSEPIENRNQAEHYSDDDTERSSVSVADIKRQSHRRFPRSTKPRIMIGTMNRTNGYTFTRYQISSSILLTLVEIVDGGLEYPVLSYRFGTELDRSTARLNHVALTLGESFRLTHQFSSPAVISSISQGARGSGALPAASSFSSSRRFWFQRVAMYRASPTLLRVIRFIHWSWVRVSALV